MAEGQIDSDGLDMALEPSDVLSAAGDYIQDTIRLTNVPTV